MNVALETMMYLRFEQWAWRHDPCLEFLKRGPKCGLSSANKLKICKGGSSAAGEDSIVRYQRNKFPRHVLE